MRRKSKEIRLFLVFCVLFVLTGISLLLKKGPDAFPEELTGWLAVSTFFVFIFWYSEGLS